MKISALTRFGEMFHFPTTAALKHTYLHSNASFAAAAQLERFLSGFESLIKKIFFLF